ncbi:hypothetical protein NicSoilC5_18180 [Arthrobacter sp. NicSoilC5]|nr:hypothetical protein NicSoilC5_18180 [Arthrobacter sp. NicSoilC5]
MSVPPDVFGKRFCGTGSISKSRCWVRVAQPAYFLVVSEGGRYHGNGECQENGKYSVANPFGAAFMGVDIDIRHDQR